jgi:glycine/D-amino acid oxidase-like deaminating enzyme
MSDAPRANRPPWSEGLPPRAPFASSLTPLDADIAIVGAGIAGVATAYFLLKSTQRRVLLLEAGRVAGGATGHNAGQLVTYFERPLHELVESFGFDPALTAQREVDGAWELLEAMCAEAGLESSVQRFVGHLGMWSENHLTVHLSSNRLRERAGLATERCIVSDRLALGALEREYGDLFEVVPHDRIRELLETRDDRYRAVLSFPKGTVNPVALCTRLLQELTKRYGARLEVAEDAHVDRIALDARGATLLVKGRRVRAERVVLCTNGYRGFAIENASGPEIDLAEQQELHGTIAFMAAYFEPRPRDSAAISYLASPRIGEGQAYYYVTRRPFVAEGQPGTLVAIGGPDRDLADWSDYLREAPVEESAVHQIEGFLRRFIAPGRDAPIRWTWHGLMGYTRNGARVSGADPRNPVLLYNLGCNGVGLLPSIAGGARVARILAGDPLPPSAFDPR